MAAYMAIPGTGPQQGRTDDRSVSLRMRGAPRKSSRIEPSILADAAKPSKRFRVSGTQRLALYAAFGGRLQLYPRGYAASKSGPFHSRRAVLGLARAGLMSISATARYAAATKRARELYADAAAAARSDGRGDDETRAAAD